MSKQRSVAGVVFITICLTSAVVVGGLIVVSRFINEPAVTTSNDTPAEAPAPRPRAARGRRAASGAGQEAGSAADAAPTGQAAGTETAAPADGQAPSAGASGQATPSAEAQSPGEGQGVRLEPAPTATEDARQIMEESQRRGLARFYRYDGLLQSFDAKNKMTEKRWTFDRVGSNGQSKSVLRFTSPAEVKGVALLIYNHPERASDQWMWTPALERDRRIALQDRSTRFFGTDFSFEDLEERDVDQFDYSMNGSETIAGAACWKIEMTPKKSRQSHYTRAIGWIRKDDYVMARLDNFVEDAVVKRLTNSIIENIQGIWTARQLEMADLRRATRTRLTLQEVKYNAPVRDSEFTLDAIRR